MDPYQLIKEAEFIGKLREQYERSPSEKLPGLRQARRSIGLRHLSPNMEAYLDNMHDLQKTFLHGESPQDTREVPLLEKTEVERVHFGFVAQCEEDDLFDEDGNPLFSQFQSFQSCVIVVSPGIEGRLVFFWEYQDCGQPEGCRLLVNPRFAKEILHNRNFLFPDIAYRVLQDSAQPVTKEERYELVLNSLQNSLVANLATEGTNRGSLINYGYMPLRRMLKDFRDANTDFEGDLANLDYTIETNLLEIHLAAARVPARVLVPIVANIPFDELADDLPEVVTEYERIAEDQFRKDLSETKEHIREIDQLFEDESLFRSLVRKLLS
jgi:hypothetical protein